MFARGHATSSRISYSAATLRIKENRNSTATAISPSLITAFPAHVRQSYKWVAAITLDNCVLKVCRSRHRRVGKTSPHKR